ncbi:hypothetical protein PRCB_16405 [Pantoea rodasii]|uniref:Uncharacterized protein n=1 Tax=Pantoea rodasii TaxID=1076549 RepID=A0A2M9WBT4_9GAMM|nr:hypothetical protein HA45_09075 [Pantoea rodasii]PJZ04984.1 hypothetical protein PRCB_16405 [Pantoea rodasii]
MNYSFFEHLNVIAPGSVSINKELGEVKVYGWDLKELVNPYCCECGTKNVKGDANGFVASPSDREDAFPKSIFLIDGSFQRVIYPFADANENTAERDSSCCCCRKSRKCTSASEKKHCASKGDQDLVPGIKGKLRKWILQAYEFLFQPL